MSGESGDSDPTSAANSTPEDSLTAQSNESSASQLATKNIGDVKLDSDKSAPPDEFEKRPTKAATTTPPPWSAPGAKSPEETANFLSKLSVWWLTPLMVLGRKFALRQSDLYPLRDSFKAASICDEFDPLWSKENAKVPPESAASLFTALWAAFGSLFLQAGFFKLFADGCSLASPVVLRYLLEVVDAGGGGRGREFGYAMAGTLFGLQILASLASNSYTARAASSGFRVRTSIVSAIYAKTLKLSPSARGEFGAINLMSVDASRLDGACSQLHQLWSAPIVVAIAMALLVAQLGPAALAGFALLLLMIPIQAWVMRHLMKLRRKTNVMTDKRVRMTQETVSGIRIVKFLGWEEAMDQHLGKVRTEELENVTAIGNWR